MVVTTEHPARNRDPIRTLVFRLTAIAVAVLLVLSLLASWLALHRFERVLYPELRLKAAGVAEILSRQINRALDYDIPLQELPGLAEALERETRVHADIASARVEDLQGQILAAYGTPSSRLAGPGGGMAAADYEIVEPLTGHGLTQAYLRLSLDPNWLTRASFDLMLEVASVILVSVLVTFEVLLLVVNLSMARVKGRNLGKPGAASSRPPVNLVFLRLPVFLFCLSEELSRPFIPAYAQHLAPTAPWLPVDLAVSLPITLFMLVWALSQPTGARFSGRIGRRSAFIVAAGLSALGLTMTALTDHLLAFLLWRCVTALGYGLALITAQGVVVDHTTGTNRASGLALFIGALLAAGVCGPVAGGIIADQAGASATLLVGAGAALAAAVALVLLFGRDPRLAAEGFSAPHAGSHANRPAIAKLAGDRRFAALMSLSAIPAKIAATSVLFFLTPLLLADSGADKAEIGRVQMLYFLAFIIISPLAATLSDRWQVRRGFIILGGLATLAGLAPMALLDQGWSAALALALFGVAQALISAPQLTLVTQISSQVRVAEITAIGWFRMLERLGGALGPLLAVALAAAWSYHAAVLGMGLLCGVSALLFGLLYRGAPPATPRSEMRS
ncbi:MAG: MFS transporter [Chromatiaceae bacterium]|nr:MFS transporter [Chromatiaceae bacterium]